MLANSARRFSGLFSCLNPCAAAGTAAAIASVSAQNDAIRALLIRRLPRFSLPSLSTFARTSLRCLRVGLSPADFLLDPLQARRSGNVVGLDPQSFAISADRIHALAGLHQRFGLSEPAIRIVGGEANRLLVRGQRIGGPARPDEMAAGIAPGLGIVPADVRAVSAARRLMRRKRGDESFRCDRLAHHAFVEQFA